MKRPKLKKHETEALAVLLKDWLEERGGAARVSSAAAEFGVGKGDIKRASRILKLPIVGGVVTIVKPPIEGHA